MNEVAGDGMSRSGNIMVSANGNGNLYIRSTKDYISVE